MLVGWLDRLSDGRRESRPSPTSETSRELLIFKNGVLVAVAALCGSFARRDLCGGGPIKRDVPSAKGKNMAVN